MYQPQQLNYLCMYGGKFELQMMDDGTLHFMWAVQTTRTWRIRIHWFQVQVCHFLQGRYVGVIHLVCIALHFSIIIFMFSKNHIFGTYNPTLLIWHVWNRENHCILEVSHIPQCDELELVVIIPRYLMKTHARYFSNSQNKNYFKCQTCKFLSWNLCGFEEGIINPMMLSLQISNIYLKYWASPIWPIIS